jgi:hypothetical protein
LISIRVEGITTANQRLETFQEGARRLGRMRILVGSNLKYAYGIEYGRRRGGRLARRAGGAFMLKKGLDSIQATLAADISRAIQQNGNIYDAVFKNALRAQDVTMANTPVKTGSLRRSFHTVSESR